MSISSTIIDRFLKFIYSYIQQLMCKKVGIKYPATLKTCHSTILWTVSFQKLHWPTAQHGQS